MADLFTCFRLVMILIGHLGMWFGKRDEACSGKVGLIIYLRIRTIANLRTGSRWFYPRLGQYSFSELMTGIATGFIPLSLVTTVRCFYNGYVGKQPVAWKEYCTEY